MLKWLSLVGCLFLISACKPVSEKSSVNNASALVALCIESQSQCEINTEFAHFKVKFSQHQLSDKVITELPFFIELTPFSQQRPLQSITKVSAYLEGRDMFMGKVPVFFEPTDEGKVYLAESLLANCSEEQMVWRLWITVELIDKKQTFFVDFTSQRF
ncbi:hypothetical protein [Colwellia psychrerythraea]|uniref:Putative lipoprotein n=1 Tax=Colwellia psychrerythraea (strain 34H / ATCC BAA-681) TaxID=167879 RepID=Q483N9_COLP3|nr:hypothetical protein [Colwellia psychrerythraea]AAZ25637.1 putative lipoprotein [Colwellia psychrerythraea 34H]